jgi:fibronectin type III domain protein
MLRRHATWATSAIVLSLLGGPACASAYTVAMRWSANGDQTIAGYRLYVQPEGGVERPPIDVPSPRHDGTGHFEGLVTDLDVETTYTFALSAYRSDGTESERSNSYTIGYAQAAAVVDSDHDGLTDAEEDTNRNLRVDAGETDRLVADSDGDEVPDGLEREFGSDPLNANSPSCGPLEFSQFRIVGTGTANVGYDPELGDLAVATTPVGLAATSIGLSYPQYGKGTITDPLIVTRIRDNESFRIDIQARSTDGKLYRLRYEGYGRINRTTRRRLRRSLGNYFTGERYELVGIDVAAEIGRMDPGAVFDHIERFSVRGSLVMQQPRVCN